MKRRSSVLFAPYRALGYITNDVPVVLQSLGNAYFLTTSIGRSFHVYNCEKLNLLFVSPQTDSPITSLATLKDFTFAACGSEIIAFKRAKEGYRLKSKSMATIFSISILGELIFGLCEDNTLRIWNTQSKELVSEQSFNDEFHITTMIHPSTYVNKILIGSREGKFQLWNIRSMKMLYEFNCFTSPVTFLSQAPAIDVIAVGLLDGTIALHNIKLDERVMTFYQEGKVTSISFRTDDVHMMATANISGDINLWDLDTRRKIHVMKGAHDRAISSIHFFHNQPVMLTAGSDNSVKEWIFDSLDDLPRLLKQRSGHHAPPTTARYYGTEGHVILSGGQDRAFRVFSTIRDEFNTELSQGSIAKKSKKFSVSADELKIPQVLKIAASPVKEKEWDNVLTCHANQWSARTWNYQRKIIGSHMFESGDKYPIKSVAVTACGNFGFVGSSAGRIDMYNMQSGIHRRTFASGGEGHHKSVEGIASDNLNRTVISASLDGTVKFWDMNTAKVMHTTKIGSPVVSILLHQDSDLLATVSDDLCIRVIDIESKKVVREFWGHQGRITDITFTPDGRWLVSSSLDGTVRTWDIPSALHIDCFRVDNVVTSLSFSPVGDFLVTTHVDQVGLFLWANRTMYSNVSLRSVAEDAEILLELPSSGSNDQEGETREWKEDDNAIHNDDGAEVPDVMSKLEDAVSYEDGMISTSQLPKSRWQNLLSLDAIKKRNKPKEPPKAPERAPFFLPTVAGVELKFEVEKSKEESKVNDAAASRVLNFGELAPVSKFVKLLRSGRETNDYSKFISYVKELPPATLDIEFRMLPLENKLIDLKSFLLAIRQQIEKQTDFELVETYLSVFLKYHADTIINAAGDEVVEDENVGVESSVERIVKEVLKVHVEGWGRLGKKFRYGLSVLNFVRLSS
ncbi:hypothetical protein HK098_002746 [Nowakowskiella sp. JEL0407]|nr:hypothetical protein HK098_002746 [Nowakowskiella sp. JEL0407]